MSIPDSEVHLLKTIESKLQSDDWSRFCQFVKKINKEQFDIPSLFAKIENLPSKISRVLMLNIQIHNINLIFNILKDINSLGIFDKYKFDQKPKDIVKSKELYNMIIECIKDLFGPPSESFITFVVSELPKFILNYLQYDSKFFFGEMIDIEDNIAVIKDILNGYTMFGLNIRKISDFRKFMENYDRKKKHSDVEGYYIVELSKSRELFGSYPFDFLNIANFSETHLINDEIFTRVRTQRDSNQTKYAFPIVSMVIRGGLGPQGKGFAYLTPFDEVCEICSDAKENKAYILEYKKFLKNQFLNELNKTINSLDINTKDKEELFEFMDANIQLNFIDSSQIEYIFNKIDDFFEKIKRTASKTSIDPHFKNKLKQYVQKILIPMEIQDQFLVRMELIKSGKITEKEIAKLVSLGNVSHYDLLVQRFFFQNLIEFVSREIKNSKKKVKKEIDFIV